MTVGSVLARGIGKSPRGLTKRMGVVAFVACGGCRLRQRRTTGSPTGLRRRTATSSTRPTSAPRLSRGWPPIRTRSGTPVMGGTLQDRRAAQTSPRLPTRRASTRRSRFGLERTYTRQLVSYPASTDLHHRRRSLVPDAASEHADGELRWPDLYLPSPLGLDVEHHAAAAGDLAGLPARHPPQLRSDACARTATPATTSRRSWASRRSAPRSRTRTRRRAPPLARRSSTTA